MCTDITERIRGASREIAAELDWDTLVRSIVGWAIELLGGASSELFLYRPERDVLEQVVSVGDAHITARRTLRRGEGFAAAVWETRQPLIVNDAHAAVVGAPVSWRDEFWGVLSVTADAPRAFSPLDADLLSQLAAQSAVSLRNARLLQLEREQRELAEALREAAVAVSSTLDLDQVLDRILEQISHVVPGDTADVGLIEDDQARVVRWRGYERLGLEAPAPGAVLQISQIPNLQQLIQTGEPIVIPDTSSNPNWVRVEGWEWVRANAMAPIRVQGQVAGFLGVNSATPYFFSLTHAQALQGFADHAAVAIENARSYQGTARRLAQTQVLREAMLAAASTLNFDQVLDRTIDALSRMLGLEYLGFLFPEEGGKFMKSHSSVLGFVLPPEGFFRFRTDQCIAGRVYRTGQPVILSDVREAEDYAEADARARSELTVPVKVGDEVVAVLNVESSRPNAFDQEDLAFYMAIAGQLGVAMQNARLYQALQDHAEYLEWRVQERTAELEARNAELERFIYTISHDLTSPLITIRGFLGYLERAARAGDMEQVQADIARIVNATDKMQQLLRELLELSRIGRLANPPEEVSFSELAEEALSLVQGRLAERGVEVYIAPGMPSVYGDRPRLREVLQNLLDNAAKFLGPQAHPRIEVGVRRAGEQVVFFVRDNGIGIDPRFHDKVFGLFEKLDQHIEGTGIGLAIVKRIVEVHGGCIWVESEGVGQGSTFCFTLSGVKRET